MRHLILAVCVCMVWMAAPCHALIIGDLGGRPQAATFDASYMYVALAEGQVKKVNISVSPPTTVGTFGSQGSEDGQLLYPEDLTIDPNGNVVVVDSGNKRLAVFSPSGAFVRNVPLSFAHSMRTLRGPGNVLLVLGWQSTLRVDKFDAQYNLIASYDVSAPCDFRASSTPVTAQLAVEDTGYFWVTEHIGCGNQYHLRRYDASGAQVGSWLRHADQISDAATVAANYEVQLVSDLFVAGGRLFVILGAGGAESGGLEVDVWTTSGTFLHRSPLVGPAAAIVRATPRGAEVFLTDTMGLQNVISVSIQALQ